MRISVFRGVEIRCSPFLPLLVPAAYLTGRMARFAAAFIALAVHEAAHAATARRAGCPVWALEIQPFGFVARLDCTYASPHDAAAVFAAGPVASLGFAASAALLSGLIARFSLSAGEAVTASLDAFSDINLMLAAVNLLPALPLDGGRLLRTMLSSRGGVNRARPACRVLSALGILFGAALTAAFFLLLHNGVFNPSLILMGVFLAFAALRELINPEGSHLRHKTIGPKGAIAVRQLAVGSEVSIARALRMLPVGAYSLVSVLDGERIIGTLSEAELISAAQALGAAASVRSAVAYRGKKVI